MRVNFTIQIATKILFASVMVGLSLYFLRLSFYQMFTALQPLWGTIAGICGLIGLVGTAATIVSPRLQHNKAFMLLPTLFLGCAIFFGSQFAIKGSASGHDSLTWYHTEQDAFSAARRENKPILVDSWAEWCEACKKMDATTFQNPDLIKYINNNFYAVRFNAESKDVIHFQGKEYSFNPQFKANTLAVELMKGSMSYPTAVIMMENFANPQAIPGYMTVPQLETILSYLGDNMYKHQAWDAYQKEYKPKWEHGTPDMTPPAGHN